MVALPAMKSLSAPLQFLIPIATDRVTDASYDLK